MAKRKRKSKVVLMGGVFSGTAMIHEPISNLEYGKRLRAEGIARRQQKERDKAIAAAKKLLGRKIYL